MDTKRFLADVFNKDQQNKTESMPTDLLDRLESALSSVSEPVSIPSLLKQWDTWNDGETGTESGSQIESSSVAKIDLDPTGTESCPELDFEDLWNRPLPVSELSLPQSQSIASVADYRLSHEELRHKLKEDQIKRLATIPLNVNFEQFELPIGASAIQPQPVTDSEIPDNILSFDANQSIDQPTDSFDCERTIRIAEPDELPTDSVDSQSDTMQPRQEQTVGNERNAEIILPLTERVAQIAASTPDQKPVSEQAPQVSQKTVQPGIISDIQTEDPISDKQTEASLNEQSDCISELKTESKADIQPVIKPKTVKPKRKLSALRWSIVIGLTALLVGLFLFGRETYPRYLLLSGLKNVTNLKIQAGSIKEDYQRGTTSVSPVLINDYLNQPLLKVKSASFSSLPVLLWKENRLDWIVLDGIEFCSSAVRKPVELPGLKESPLQADYELYLVKTFQPFVGTELRNQAQKRMKTMDLEISQLTQQLGQELMLIQGNVKQLQEIVSPDSESLPGLVDASEKSFSPEAAIQRSIEIRTQLKDALTQWREAKDRWSLQAKNLLDDKNFPVKTVASESGIQIAADAVAGGKPEDECLLPGLPDELSATENSATENTANNQPAPEIAEAKMSTVEQPVGAQANATDAHEKTGFQPQPQLFNEYLFGSVYKPFLNQFYQDIIGVTQWLPDLRNALKESGSNGKTAIVIQSEQVADKQPTIGGFFANPVEINRDLTIGQIRLSGTIKFMGENQPFTGIVSNLNSRNPSRPTVVDLTFNSRFPSRLRLVVIPTPNDKQKISVEYYRPGSTLIPQIGRPSGVCLTFFRKKEQPTAEQAAAESAQPTRTDSIQMEIVDGQLTGEYRCIQNNIACELFIPGICSDEGLQKAHFLSSRISGFELTAKLSGTLVSPQLYCSSNIESLETGTEQIVQAERELQRLRFVQTLESEWTAPIQQLSNRIEETHKKLESVVLVNRVVIDQTVQLCQNRLEQENLKQMQPEETNNLETAPEMPPVIPDLTESPAQTEEELKLEQSRTEEAGQASNANPEVLSETDYYQNQNPQTAEKLDSNNPLR